MANLTHSTFAADFSAKVRKALLVKGVTIVGITVIPDMTSDMPFANGRRGYELTVNGTFCIRDYFEVEALAR